MANDLSRFDINELEKIGGEKLLLNIEIGISNLDEWLSFNAQHINRLLQKNGALLVRGLLVQGSKKLEKVLTEIFAQDLLEYTYRSTPRTKMRGRIYTSSEYHPNQTILQHNENSYSNNWPMRIAFYCVKPADIGGATPIANSRKVYTHIPAFIRENFEHKKFLYIRNYGEIDLPWTEVFQTEDREEVEKYCRINDIEYKWIGKHQLRTQQLGNASYFHPMTGEKLWFNQAHLFHISSLNNNGEDLLNVYDKEDLPRNVYYGNGEDIDPKALECIRKVYQDNMVIFDWKEGDLLLLDNMRYSHGRKPFVGSRRILVGMAELMNAKRQEMQKTNDEELLNDL